MVGKVKQGVLCSICLQRTHVLCYDPVSVMLKLTVLTHCAEHDVEPLSHVLCCPFRSCPRFARDSNMDLKED